MTKQFSIHKILRAALLGSCFFFAACENDPKVIADLTRDEVSVDHGKKIETLISQGGRLKARLTAPDMLRYQNDSAIVEFPNSLKVDFYNAAGIVESHLDSKYGKYYENLNKVLLRDSVLAFNFSGDTLKTPELWWDQSTQQIYTDKPVRIRKSGHLIYGVGMDARQDLSNIRIRQVTGQLAVPDSISGQ